MKLAVAAIAFSIFCMSSAMADGYNAFGDYMAGGENHLVIDAPSGGCYVEYDTFCQAPQNWAFQGHYDGYEPSGTFVLTCYRSGRSSNIYSYVSGSGPCDQ